MLELQKRFTLPNFIWVNKQKRKILPTGSKSLERCSRCILLMNGWHLTHRLTSKQSTKRSKLRTEATTLFCQALDSILTILQIWSLIRTQRARLCLRNQTSQTWCFLGLKRWQQFLSLLKLCKRWASSSSTHSDGVLRKIKTCCAMLCWRMKPWITFLSSSSQTSASKEVQHASSTIRSLILMW